MTLALVHLGVALFGGGALFMIAFARIEEVLVRQYEPGRFTGMAAVDLIHYRDRWVTGRRGDVWRCWLLSAICFAWIIYATLSAIDTLCGGRIPDEIVGTVSVIALLIAPAIGQTRYNITDRVAEINETFAA